MYTFIDRMMVIPHRIGPSLTEDRDAPSFLSFVKNKINAFYRVSTGMEGIY